MFALTACGGGSSTEPDSVAEEAVATPSSTTSPSSAAATPTPTSTGEDEALRVAVQTYSDAFLDGDPVEAYEVFSARCKAEVSLSFFTGIVTAAKMTYGSALPIQTYEAQVDGDLARVTYTYDVPALNQSAEPWVREDGVWRQDDC